MSSLRPVLIPRVLVPLAAATLAALFLMGAVKENKAPRSSLVRRGEQLSLTSGCNDCHTPGFFYGAPDMSRRLAGSEVGWQGPWGVTYPRNLTPDRETGIGTWSDADIERALRTGVRPNGTAILPPMPWQEFSHFSKEDMTALIAYLKSIPPVRHKAPDRIPPGAPVAGAVLVIPPPPAWDAPRSAESSTAHRNK